MDNREMIATVECYIHHRTNKQIRIAPIKAKDLFLLTKAYENCKAFFIKH